MKKILFALAITASASDYALPDRLRIELLLAQRDWNEVRVKYEEAFRREPRVVLYDAKVQELQTLCRSASKVLDLDTATCQATQDKVK